MRGGHRHTNGLDTAKRVLRTFICMNGTEIQTNTSNGRCHRLTSIFAAATGRSAVPMRSLTTKILAAMAIFVVAGTTALAPAALAWSDDDAAVAIVARGGSWGNMQDVDVAADGSIYACGHIRGETDLDPHPIKEVMVDPGSSQAGLVVKLDSDGNYVWHATVDTTEGSITSCVVAGDGSVYATGFFRKGVQVDGTDPLYAVTSAVNGNNDNAFVAKFSADGSGEWLRTVDAATDTASSYGYSVDVDSEGSAYVTGKFAKTVDLDLDAGPGFVDSHTGNKHGRTFFVKLDAAGTNQWSHSWGGTAGTQGMALVVDNAGDIVVGGWTFPTVMDLDPDPDDELIVLSGGSSNHKKRQAWMSKFDKDGDLIWGHTFGSKWETWLRGLAVDADNNVYATGFTGRDGKTATGGDWQADKALDDAGVRIEPAMPLNGVQHRDIYTAKFDSSGTTQWVNIYGGHNKVNLTGRGIAVAGDAVYTTGSYRGTVDFSRGTHTLTSVHNAGTMDDAFLVRHNATDGSFECVVTIDDSNLDARSSNVAVDSAGNAYIAGYFHGTADFDPAADVAAGDLVGNQTLFTSDGGSEGFVARYTPDCALDAAAETTDVEDPIVEDPIVEDPIVEDPIVEDPIVEDPIVEDPEDVTPVPDVVDPEPIVDPGTVDITGDILCSTVQVVWAPDVDGEIQSFVLATKAPGATWTAHSTHTAATDRITIGGLVDGTHAFRVMAVLVDSPPVVSGEFPVEVSSCAPVIPDVEDVVVEPIAEEGMVEPIVEDVVVEPIAEEDMVEPIVEDVVVEPIADEVTVEPIVEEAIVEEAIVEEVVVEEVVEEAIVEEVVEEVVEDTPEVIVEEEADDNIVVIPDAAATPDGGEGPGNGTNPEANNTAPGTSGTGNTSISSSLGNTVDAGTLVAGTNSDFSEGSRIPLSSSTLATAAGIAAAAGLGLSGVGARIGTALLRFLSSTGAGLFLIGLFRRDRRPGAPENFVIFSSGQITNLVWTAPTAGKAPERYIVEGSVNGYWREVFEFGTNVCRAGVPTSEIESICNWRLRAANEHGVGKPSNEAILEAGTAEATTDLPMAA